MVKRNGYADHILRARHALLCNTYVQQYVGIFHPLALTRHRILNIHFPIHHQRGFVDKPILKLEDYKHQTILHNALVMHIKYLCIPADSLHRPVVRSIVIATRNISYM